MTAEEVAARYNRLPGFRLADYHSVALPLWFINFDALVIAEKKVSVVDEFILRAVDRQVDTVPDLAGFLGLSEKLILRRLGAQMGSDLLLSVPGVEAGTFVLKLTRKGLNQVHEAARTPPRREKLSLAYDAIARQPIAGRIAREALRTIQQVKLLGLFEVPAMPGRAPDEAELAKINYNDAFTRETRKDRKIHQVLSAHKVGTVTRRYREAVMLIYLGATDPEQVTVRFFSNDGRPMPEVDRGFHQRGGLQKLGVSEQLKQHRAELEKELQQDPDYRTVVEFARQAGGPSDVSASLAQEAKLSSAIQDKQAEVAAAMKPPAELEALRAEVQKLRQEKADVARVLDVNQGRFLEPQEHVPMFDKAFRSATRRLLVISPWVYDSIMKPRFAQLDALLRKGVDVYIGFGISATESDPRKAKKGAETMSWFEAKSAQYRNLHVVRLGDTHAKVLLVDDSFVVVGSFNWMSFGGFDHTEGGFRVVREELSTMVTVPAMIEQMFVRFRSRFDRFTHPSTPVTAQVPSPVPVAKPAPSKSLPPMNLTPRMVAAHLGKKAFQVIVIASQKDPAIGIDTRMPDAIIELIYREFKAPLPSSLELDLLRDPNSRL